MTLTDTTAGVLVAGDDDRPARLATLSEGESTWDPSPVDAEVVVSSLGPPPSCALVAAGSRPSARWWTPRRSPSRYLS